MTASTDEIRADRYDVAIIGAGPVGATAALACAQRGQRVLLLERDPWVDAASERCLGEWIHPRGVDVLESLGVELNPPVSYATGRGFAVHPGDGTDPIVLPYRAPRAGFAIERAVLVETLRGHAEQHEGIDYIRFARALRLEADALTIELRALSSTTPNPSRGAPLSRTVSTAKTVRATRVVGATGSGPRPVVRGDVRIFAGEGPSAPVHRICGLVLHDVELPFEGYYHVFVGGLGPAMAYRIGPSRVRLLLDVPLSARIPTNGGVELFEAYAPALPEALVEPLQKTLRDVNQRARPPTSGSIAWCQGQLRPRTHLVEGNLLWAGDAAGSVHPLTAAGLTLGLVDAASVARAESPTVYRRARWRDTRIAETAAVGLAEIFSDPSQESVELRTAVFRMWRDHASERLRTMGYIGGDSVGAAGFAKSSLGVLANGAREIAARGVRHGLVGDVRHVGSRLLTRVGWMLGGSVGWTEALPRRWEERLEAEAGAAARFGGALRSSDATGIVVGLPGRTNPTTTTDRALRRAVDALVRVQAGDGSFEGEVVWCPMLAAQYVLAHHAMGRELSEERRAKVLLHFERTQLSGGAWGLHELSEPYLFVTALVYVAARLLGKDKHDPLLREAHAFIRGEGGVVGIPSWGKLWLAIVGLYDWDGVSPIAPELWTAPRWLPMHPSRYYCHTRLIYMGMATLYGERFVGPSTPTIRALKDELYVAPYDEIDFARARRTLRRAEIHQMPSAALELSYRALGALERVRDRQKRNAILDELRERIRYELRSTSHTCISPVSGLLDILALHAADTDDPDVAIALERFEGWVWEDDVDGARVTGARSATWDTSFATQALSVAAETPEIAAMVREPLRRADAFLESQQIVEGTGREADNDRLDPAGGYCFAGVWHGWPVSDCTAEAVLARLDNPQSAASVEALERAVEFILRTRNHDGGFGSYEARRVALPIDWLNPSEMFGACMTERSYVECTASCVAALARYRERHPMALPEGTEHAIATGVENLRAAQRPDGSWPGMWGVHFIYGTMFGVRGLIAGGVPSTDPQVRRACAWLAERQRADGGWGEHFSSVVEARYVEHEHGQFVQTAWALSTLVEAEHADIAVLTRAADFLARAQDDDGTWARQDPEGVFFHTALLEYELYRRYFPLWALAQYRVRIAKRDAITSALTTPEPAPPFTDRPRA